MAAARRAPGPSPWMVALGSRPVVWAVAGVLGLAVCVLGWPGLLLVWLGVVVHGFAVRPPELHGPKDPSGRPTPLDSTERTQMTRFMTGRAMKDGALNPSLLVPVKKTVTADQVAAWCCAGLAATVPQAWAWSRLIDAVAVGLVVVGVAASRRAASSQDVPVPRSPVTDLFAVVRDKPAACAVVGAVGGAVGVVVAFAALVVSRMGWVQVVRDGFWSSVGTSWAVPDWVRDPGRTPGWAVLVVVAALGALVAVWPRWKARSMHGWELAVDAQVLWARVWEEQKVAPAPRVVRTDEVVVDGQVAGLVDTIAAAPAVVEQMVMRHATWRTGLGDVKAEVVFLSSLVVDQNGQPVAGQRSTESFRTVRWTGPDPDSRHPSILAEGVDDATAFLLAECAASLGAMNLVPPLAPPLILSMRSCVTHGTGGDDEHGEINVDGTGDEEPSDVRENDEVSGNAWLVDLTDPWGDDWGSIRSTLAPSMGGWLGCRVVVDTAPKLNRRDIPKRMVLGDLDLPAERWDTSILPVPDTHQPPTCPVYFADLATEDSWTGVWQRVLKATVPPPRIAHTMSWTKPLTVARGTLDVSCATFAIPGGVDAASSILPAEDQMRTLVQPKPADLTLTALPELRQMPGARPGDRNPNGVRVLSTVLPVPSPHQIPPQADTGPNPGLRMGSPAPGRETSQAETAARWAFTILVNRAFDAVKLARPEVMRQDCLTLAESAEHIWQVNLRLYGGVTVKKISDAVEGLRSTMHAPWLTASDLPNGDALLLVGADPSPSDGETQRLDDGAFLVGAPDDTDDVPRLSAGVRLPPPRARRARARVAMSEQAHVRVDDILYRTYWGASKVVAPNGARPAMVSSRPLETNPSITERVFKLPPGVGLPTVRAAVNTMKATSGNAFVEVRPTDDATKVMVLFARNDPMPTYAPYDFASPCRMDDAPFGVRTDGTTMSVDLTVFTHLLLTGTSNSGKSGCAQALLMSMLRAGCQAMVIDYSVKKAADFIRFAPWLSGIATDETHAQALLETVVAEISRRVALYTEHGGANLAAIPPDLRPPHLVVLFDEMSEALKIPPKPPSTANPNPLEEAKRLDRVRQYAIRTRIASLTDTIAATGRSAGVHLICVSQAMKADSLPAEAPNLKGNVSMCLLGAATDGQRRSGLINPDSAPDPGENVPPGRGVWDPRIGTPELVQFWYAEIGEYVGWLEANLAPAEQVDVSAHIPKESDLVGFSITSVDANAVPAVDADAVERISWDEAGIDWDDILGDLGASADTEPETVPSVPIDPENAPEWRTALSATIGSPVHSITSDEDEQTITQLPADSPIPRHSDPSWQPISPSTTVPVRPAHAWEDVDWSDSDPVPDVPATDDPGAVSPVAVDDSREEDRVKPSAGPPPVRRKPVSMADLLGPS